MSEAVVIPVQPLETEYIGAHRAAEEAETAHSGWRNRLGQIAGRAALALGVAGGLTGIGSAIEQSPAEAASISCYGDYCSGQYADQTGCDQDAETVAQADIIGIETRWDVNANTERSAGVESSGIQIKLGEVELRYSPVCKTKWARMTTTHNSDITNISVMQDTGYKQTRVVNAFWKGSPPATAFSPMIYSPNVTVHAYVEGGNLLNLSTDWK